MNELKVQVSRFKVQSSVFESNFIRLKLLSAFFILLLCFPACSVPNLEQPECTASRDVVKKFYSFHFGNDLMPSAENLKLREKFLTPELTSELKNQPVTKRDYFTQTDDYPKAFRIGGCQIVNADRTDLEVVLFWKTEERSEQRTVNVETVKQNENWLIGKVEAKP